MKQRCQTHRLFTPLVLIASLCLTATGQSARADNDDVARWIAGAAALAIVDAAIDRERDRDRAQKRRQNEITRFYDDVSRADRFREQDTRRGVYRNNNRVRDNRFGLPQQCMRRARTNRGEVFGYGRKCLRRTFGNVGMLPDKCAVRLRDIGGPRGVIYRQRCLERHGFFMASNGRR